MNSKEKHIILIITFAVCILTAFQNLNSVAQFVLNIVNIIMPVIIGGILAFVVSVPINSYNRLWLKLNTKLKKPKSSKAIYIFSVITTLITILAIISLVIGLVVPEIVSSVNVIVQEVKIKWPEWKELLASYNIDTEPLIEWLESFNIQELLSKTFKSLGSVASSIKGTVSSTISTAITIIFSLIVMFYILLFKNDIARHIKKLLYANIKKEIVDKTIDIAKLTKDTYSKFLSGQCIESAILGILMLIALSIFRLPYAGLIAILTFVCAFIPYIGAFVSCGVGIFLILLSSPEQALIFFIVYEITQFIENQFIYPRVVGSSVGISPFYTFLAVLIGGKLFGLVGILFFIPLTAVVYTLVKENSNKKLLEKNINIT